MNQNMEAALAKVQRIIERISDCPDKAAMLAKYEEFKALARLADERQNMKDAHDAERAS